MFCKFCGAEIKEDAAFCQKCGKKTEIIAEHDIVKEHAPQEISIPDIWIWCLAILPLIISIAMEKAGLITSLFGNTDSSITSILSWAVPIALNVFFIKQDNAVLTNLRFYTSEWFYIGIFLVPLYLIIREVKTNRNFAPTVIWFFLFAVYIFIL